MNTIRHIDHRTKLIFVFMWNKFKYYSNIWNKFTIYSLSFIKHYYFVDIWNLYLSFIWFIDIFSTLYHVRSLKLLGICKPCWFRPLLWTLRDILIDHRAIHVYIKIDHARCVFCMNYSRSFSFAEKLRLSFATFH